MYYFQADHKSFYIFMDYVGKTYSVLPVRKDTIQLCYRLNKFKLTTCLLGWLKSNYLITNYVSQYAQPKPCKKERKRKKTVSVYRPQSHYNIVRWWNIQIRKDLYTLV